MTAMFRDPDVASAEIVCTWSMSAWTCLPDQEEFQFDDPERPWFVRIEGPAGAVEIERDPFSTDPGEGWPTSCPHCYPYWFPYIRPISRRCFPIESRSRREPMPPQPIHWGHGAARVRHGITEPVAQCRALRWLLGVANRRGEALRFR